MKTLTKIRLIHWHYFQNETINVHKNVLLSGQNASGKSTILDAISFVLTAGDQSFNMAANEKGKRDLKGYVKCKLGSDDREYLREGDVTGHVALEFYDELKKEYFTVGVVIDAFGEGRPKTQFYSKKGVIGKDMFTDDSGVVLSIMNFRKAHRDYEFYSTIKETKNRYRSIFGSVNERYFNLIPKALAFKPISDVKDFIYQHLLEEKTIEVDSIQDSIRSYKELEETLKIIRKKVDALTEIQTKYEDIASFKGKNKLYKYVLGTIDLEKNRKDISDKTRELEHVKMNSEKKLIELGSVQNEIFSLDERSKILFSQLQSDTDFRSQEVFDRQIDTLRSELATLNTQAKATVERRNAVRDLAKDLKERTGAPIYQEIYSLMNTEITVDNLSRAQKSFLELSDKLSDYTYTLLNQKAKIQAEKEDITRKIQGVSSVMKKLENRKLSYPDMITNLQSLISKELSNRYQKEISVHVLAELLEITDESWHDTLENFLGAQRFNLIVEPRYYDDALRAYDSIKRTTKVYGVGLVNTKKITQYTNYQKNSLASIISTDNPDARHYINYYCGNVIMCDTVDELDTYSSSITKSGMLYRGYIVRPLNDNIEKPFIGKNAVDDQRKKYTTIGLQLREQYVKCDSDMQNITMQINDMNSIRLKDFIPTLDIELKMNSKNETMKTLIMKKAEIAKKGMSAIEKEYNSVKDEIKKRNDLLNSMNQEIGQFSQEKKNIELQIGELTQAGLEIANSLEEYLKEDITFKEQTLEILKDAHGSLSQLNKIHVEYAQMLDVEEKNLLNMEDSLKALQYKYDVEFNSGFGTGLENMPSFTLELDRLVKSELIKYESKVRQAREHAELVFKEDFLSKLRDYIKTAQQEISEINAALKTVKFGSDSYQFVFPKSQEYGGIYEMVTSDENFELGHSIFTPEFQAKYDDELNRLFDELSQDELNSKGALNKFMDYRTYMDYDIEITNKSGAVTKYSKVFKEKSGGETQVPFYVAVIASFVQIYQQATKNPNNDAVCLVLFDEVFDKMDSTRIKAMMSFIKELPIQIILATPPQRIEIISKYTDTTVIVYRDNTRVKTEQTIKMTA